MEQQFSLSWREFQGNLSSGCAHLLATGDFADVTLAADGRLLKAHKLVLSICSPFFRRVFHANPCQHPIVVLKDISYGAMKDLLQFMYNGEVSVKQEDLTNLISTAETLEVKGLTNKSKTQENNNDISPEPPKSHTYFNGNGSDYLDSNGANGARVNDENLLNGNHNSQIRQSEFFDQLNKIAAQKRKSESAFIKSFMAENHQTPEQQPEKRVKLREKQILNRHKISIIHNRNMLNRSVSGDKPKKRVIGDFDNDIVETPLPQYSDKRVVVDDTSIETVEVAASPVKERNDSNNVDTQPVSEVKQENEEGDVCSFEAANPKSNHSIVNESNAMSPENLSLSSPSPHAPDTDGVNANSESLPSPLAPWPGSARSHEDLPSTFLTHKIVTIPQKEDGKKKYPQKSCRYCWRAGRRRDTRFMCEQCCVPLCKLVCFEKHQAALLKKNECYDIPLTN